MSEITVSSDLLQEILQTLRRLEGATGNGGGSSVPLGNWLFTWLETYKAPVLKPQTLRGYRLLVSVLRSSALSAIPLCELTAEHLQHFFNSVSGGNLRIKYSHILRPALAKAVKLHMLSFSPFDGVELRNHKTTHYMPLPFEVQNAVLSRAYGKYLSSCWVLCCTGLRPGEFFGLDLRQDVDYTRMEISVHASRDVITGELYFTPKTESSIRRIPFTEQLVPHLSYLAALTSPVTYASISVYFKRLFHRLGVEHNLYSFRHTFISLCYYCGMPEKYIQTFAGHSSITTTMNIYTHILTPGSSPFCDYIRDLTKKIAPR